MSNRKSVRGVWWAYAAALVLLAAGCVSAASEESSGSAPASESSSIGGGSGSVGGAVSSSVISSSGSPPPAGGVTTTGVEGVNATAVQVGEENDGGGVAVPGGGAGPVDEVVSAEVGVSGEGLERLRRVLGEDKFAVVVEEAERSAESGSLGEGSGVGLGRLAGENGFLTEEGLGRLAERRSGEELAGAGYFYSEEVLAAYANEDEERMAGPRDSYDVSDFEGRSLFYGEFVDEYSDEEVKGWAFYERAQAELDNRLWEGNDLSTPVGAFCWAVLRVRHIEGWAGTGIGRGFRPWDSRNLKVWHLEREAEERGIELEWETPPLDANRVLRRVLLEATAPEVRSVVFNPGLPSVLRPAAEGLYSVYDELLALPLRRIRPRVEELSEYRRLKELTEEEIAQIWPEEFELDYRGEDQAKHLDAMGVLRDDAVRELLNAECKQRLPESACPPWEIEVSEERGSILSELCGNKLKDLLELRRVVSCPLFYKADPREVGYEALQSECTANEEAAERLRELEEREMDR